MHLEVFVEEPSAEAALANLLPRVLLPGETHRFHPFGGKRDLLEKLPTRLRAYRAWRPEDWGILIVVDRDSDDCKALKDRLASDVDAAGLGPKGRRKSGKLRVLTRIAVEELEAWFFGDVEAIRAAYPRVPRTLGQRAKYRDPDAITGGTWEALERVLQQVGYYQGGMPKIEVAQRISQHMDPERNRSHSFQVFRDGVRALSAELGR